MNRDMDLIRTILLQIEADPKFDGSDNPIDAAILGITDRANMEVMYHVCQRSSESPPSESFETPPWLIASAGGCARGQPPRHSV